MEFETKLKKILYEIGLTEIQSNVYFYILKSGGSQVTKIAMTLKINRTNTYTIIDKLKALNLLWEENKLNGKILYARSYDSILKNLKFKKDIILDYEKDITNLIPLFNSFSSLTSRYHPKIRSYEGSDGLDELVNDILDSNNNSSEILLFTNQADEREIFNNPKHNNFIKRRIAKNIYIKVLAVDNPNAYELRNKDKESLRMTKILPSSFFFKSEIYIYDGRISMLDFKEDNIIGVIIESSELFEIHKQLFEFIWNITK